MAFLLCHLRKKYHRQRVMSVPKFQRDRGENGEERSVERMREGGGRYCFYFSFPCSVCLRASQRLSKRHFKAFCLNLLLLYFIGPFLFSTKRTKEWRWVLWKWDNRAFISLIFCLCNYVNVQLLQRLCTNMRCLLHTVITGSRTVCLCSPMRPVPFIK